MNVIKMPNARPRPSADKEMFVRVYSHDDGEPKYWHIYLLEFLSAYELDAENVELYHDHLAAFGCITIPAPHHPEGAFDVVWPGMPMRTITASNAAGTSTHEGTDAVHDSAH
jgi:hypothetical protein